MSMPIIQIGERPVTMEQAIIDLLESVALEETALSHILNAEGEKLQRYLQVDDLSAESILAVNDSVTSMVNSVTSLEVILKDKLEFVCCKLYRYTPSCWCGDEDCCQSECGEGECCGEETAEGCAERAPEPPEYEVC